MYMESQVALHLGKVFQRFDTTSVRRSFLAVFA
jgi:hypothetical protein